MKYSIISGSTRLNKNQSLKIAKFIENIILHTLKQEVFLLDLSSVSIKYWDESFWKSHATFDSNWNKVRAELSSSDGIVIIAPEWNGSIPPALRNIFHLAVKGEFANKPALLISVSSSINGVYPIVELKISSAKNSYINYIPQHIIIRNATAVLNSNNSYTSEEDKIIQERIIYVLKVLNVYTENFIQIRNSDIIKNYPYPNGM
ncbi:MAG: NAD(P)H-dependent oxidoreductase [Burkholderiales bacterium]|nr:NAD(P)H-dependent oxidoreductase [Burkholderiales bacterium]